MTTNFSDVFVSVIIPTCNRKDSLKRCLISLFNQTYSVEKHEIIVVDDGSKDGTKELVSELQEIAKKQNLKFRYLRQENKGPGCARNLGAENSFGEIIAFTDDDCVLFHDWIRTIVDCYQDHPDIAACGVQPVDIIESGIFSSITKCFEQKSHENKNKFYFSYGFAPFKIISGENVSIKKDVFREVGGYDPKFKFYGEDVDLIYRLLKKGYKVLYNPKIESSHYARTTVKEIYNQKYGFGLINPINLKDHFKNWLIIDFYLNKFVGLREFFYIKKFPITAYFRVDLLKILIFLFVLIYFSPWLYFGVIFILLISCSIKLKSFRLMFIFIIYNLIREIGFLLGNMKGSIQHKVLSI